VKPRVKCVTLYLCQTREYLLFKLGIDWESRLASLELAVAERRTLPMAMRFDLNSANRIIR
jgi:hypothetical protein